MTRFLLAFGAAVAVLGLLVGVIDLLLHLEDVQEAEGGFGGGLELLALRAAALYLPFLLPFATFVAAFLTTAFTARSNEMIAIKVAGVSPLRAIAPVLLGAAALSVGTLALSETISVRAAAALEQRTGDGPADRFRSADSIWYHTGRFVYNVRSANAEGDLLEGVRIFERDDRGRMVRVVEAARASRLAGSSWRFEDVRVRRYDPETPGEPPAYERADVLDLSLEEEDGALRLRGDLEGVPLWELARARSAGDAERVEAVLHRRLSHGLLALVLALVAAPLGLQVERVRNLAGPASQGALALFLLLTAREYGASLSGAGSSAIVASWLPLALFAAWGCVGLARAPR